MTRPVGEHVQEGATVEVRCGQVRLLGQYVTQCVGVAAVHRRDRTRSGLGRHLSWT